MRHVSARESCLVLIDLVNHLLRLAWIHGHLHRITIQCYVVYVVVQIVPAVAIGGALPAVPASLCHTLVGVGGSSFSTFMKYLKLCFHLSTHLSAQQSSCEQWTGSWEGART